MDALRILAASILLAAAPARADPIDQWRTHIAEASLRFGIPAVWIEQVMRAESAGMTELKGRPITSHAGAMGLMQLMPGTWAEMRSTLGLGNNPHDPRDNILAGTAYLRMMYDRFGYPGLFAAYNAGPGRYAAHVRSGRALPEETRTYLAKVAVGNEAPPTLDGAQTVTVTPRRNEIFFVLAGAEGDSGAGDRARSPFEPDWR